MAEEQGRRATRQEWAKRVERWEDSGLTAREFAGEMNINVGTLRQWKYRLEGERRGTLRGRSVNPAARTEQSHMKGGEFVELGAAVSQVPRFEVSVGCYRLQVPGGFDDSDLKRLLRVLESLQ